MRILNTLLIACICVLSACSPQPTVDTFDPTKWIRMDSEYAEMTIQQVMVVRAFASLKMLEDGWTKKNYWLNMMDCEDYAQRMKTEMLMVAKNRCLLNGKAIPVGVFCYTTDRGTGHAVIFAVCGEKVFFFEPYAEDQNPIQLSKTELASSMFKWF